MKLELITLTGPKVEEEVYEVILPTTTGAIAVLPRHEPLVTLVISGAIGVRRRKDDNDVEYYATIGGIAEIGNNRVRLLVDEADHANEIAVEEARAALKRAEEAKKSAKTKVGIEEAQAMIDRYAVRIRVAELHHRRRSSNSRQTLQ